MPVMLAASVEHASVLLALLIMLASAKIMAEAFERLRQPAVVGEILAGIVIGPSLLNWVQPSEFITILAEIGVIFLLFNVGLETKPQAILAVGKRAFIVAVLGVVVPFIAGYLIALWWGGSIVEAMFIGAALVATSVGITARVLASLGLLDAPTARIILGAAVIDDVLGLLILSVVSSFSKGSVDYYELSKTAGLAVFFTLFVVFVGARLVTRLAPKIEKLRVSKPFFNAGLILCLGLSLAANYVGVAAIIGAFLAGMTLAEATEDNEKMHKMTNGVMEFFVPFFLINIGMQLDLRIFQDTSVILLALIVTIVAVLTKFLACGLGAYGLGWRRSAQIGIGMVPRGEVGIVVAQIGLGLAVINQAFFAAVLFMAIATTLIAPPFIKWFFASEEAAQGKIGDDDAGGIVDETEDWSRIG
jgi:Kef-type K+ transport system membrane component KefB